MQLDFRGPESPSSKAWRCPLATAEVAGAVKWSSKTVVGVPIDGLRVSVAVGAAGREWVAVEDELAVPQAATMATRPAAALVRNKPESAVRLIARPMLTALVENRVRPRRRKRPAQPGLR